MDPTTPGTLLSILKDALALLGPLGKLFQRCQRALLRRMRRNATNSNAPIATPLHNLGRRNSYVPRDKAGVLQ
jgi:hypothetical protein